MSALEPLREAGPSPSLLAVKNPGTEAHLVRAVGLWGLAAGIVNLTIGAGIFRLPAQAAGALGAGAPLAYVACAVVMGLIVLCFAEAGSRVSRTGGLYAYVEAAFGPLAGFIAGVLLWAGLSAATAAVATFLAVSVGALSPSLASPPARAALLTLLFAALAALNITGVRRAARVNTLVTLAKLVPIIVFVVAGLASLDRHNLRWNAPPRVADVSAASAMLIFAFLGVESALVPSGEIRDTERTVPRAILIAIAAVAALYLAVQVVAQSALGDSLARAETPVADAARVILGPWGRTLVLVGSSVSMLGHVSGMTLSVPRLLFAFGRDGFLPGKVASVHARFRTPHVAIVAQTVLSLALALTGTWEPLAYIANGAVLAVYAACCVATLRLRSRGVNAERAPFVAPGGPFIPIAAFAAVAWLLAHIPIRELLAVASVTVAALLLYVATRGVRATRAVA